MIIYLILAKKFLLLLFLLSQLVWHSFRIAQVWENKKKGGFTIENVFEYEIKKRSKIYHVNDWKETFRILSDSRLTSTSQDSIL